LRLHIALHFSTNKKDLFGRLTKLEGRSGERQPGQISGFEQHALANSTGKRYVAVAAVKKPKYKASRRVNPSGEAKGEYASTRFRTA
jgi:hypothetical protein